MNDKVVRVTLNEAGFPIPDQDPVPVKQNQQKVRFCADFDFSIRIDGYSDVSNSRGNGDCAFEVKTGLFSSERQYKYDIIANGKTTDPILDIKP